MMDRPSLAERRAMRTLADLGGRATSNELRDHPDYVTMTHYNRLRKDGYADSRPACHLDTSPRTLEWVLTDLGREVLHEEAEAWETARDALEDGDDGAEA